MGMIISMMGRPYFSIPVPPNTWVSKSSMPTPRGALSTVEYNGNIYCIGGTNGTSLNTLEIYNIVSDTWSIGTNMPSIRSGMFSGLYNGKIYCCGGTSDGSNPVNNLYEYTIATDSWVNKTSMPNNAMLGSSVSYGKYLYCLGGQNAYDTGYDGVRIYDMELDSWDSGVSLLQGKWGTGASIIGTTIYLIGGTYKDGGYVITNHNQSFDINTGIWTNNPSLPGSLEYGTCSIFQGNLYFIGGTSGFGSPGVNQVLEYNISGQTYTIKETMITGRVSLGVNVFSNAIYAIGGSASITGANEAYIP